MPRSSNPAGCPEHFEVLLRHDLPFFADASKEKWNLCRAHQANQHKGVAAIGPYG